MCAMLPAEGYKHELGRTGHKQIGMYKMLLLPGALSKERRSYKAAPAQQIYDKDH